MFPFREQRSFSPVSVSCVIFSAPFRKLAFPFDLAEIDLLDTQETLLERIGAVRQGEIDGSRPVLQRLRRPAESRWPPSAFP